MRVLYAFDAEAEGELSVAEGDSLWVEAEVDGWYQVREQGPLWPPGGRAAVQWLILHARRVRSGDEACSAQTAACCELLR